MSLPAMTSPEVTVAATVADPSAERLRQLLTGRLTVAALEETAAILRTWVEQGGPPAQADTRSLAGLLDGAGDWLTGWQSCVEDLRARRTLDERADRALAGQPEGISAWAYSDR